MFCPHHRPRRRRRDPHRPTPRHTILHRHPDGENAVDESRVPDRLAGVDLFTPVVPEDQLHPHFVTVANEPSYYAARVVMAEVFDSWSDADPHFVREFQTAGFDARTWELYLRAVLVDLGFEVDTVGNRPDFRCRSEDLTLFVEATTANPSGGPRPVPGSVDEHIRDVQQSLSDYDEIAIRLGSALFSKQQKAYHLLPHVSGQPLLFAIEGFWDTSSLSYADGPLLRYLYGVDVVSTETPTGLELAWEPIDAHRAKAKVIPSAWFSHRGNEHVAGVLFSNAGTVPKFGRMGVIAGHTHSRLAMMRRMGFELDPAPDALLPRYFVEDVGDVHERWSESLVLLHNPLAEHPIDPEAFINVTQVVLTDEGLVLLPAPRHVFAQTTVIIQTRNE